MADIARTRVKYNGKSYLPGEEVENLKAADRKRLRELGALRDGVSQADVQKAEAYQQRVDAAETAAAEAEEALAAAEAAVEQADSKEATAKAEKERDAAQEALTRAQERLEALTG